MHGLWLHTAEHMHEVTFRLSKAVTMTSPGQKYLSLQYRQFHMTFSRALHAPQSTKSM